MASNNPSNCRGGFIVATLAVVIALFGAVALTQDPIEPPVALRAR